jgi:hypothetical protein
MKMILGSPMQLMATDKRLFMPPENEPACVVDIISYLT